MDRNKQEYLAGLCAIALFVQISAAQVPCEYDVTIIAAPVECGLGTVNTFGLGINENGAVVGYYQCPLWEHSEAFVWSAEEGFITLDRPEGVYSAAAGDINDSGVICGSVLVTGLGYRGFVYDSGKWIILDPVVPDAGWSGANAINNAGVVVGQRSITKNLNPQNAYFWSVENGFTDLGVMNGPNSAARDINEQGIICGWTGVLLSSDEAFVWSDGELSFLGPIPGGESSTGSAINALGQVCGVGVIKSKDSPTVGAGFVWNDGVFTLIEPIDGYDTSGSGCINDGGQVTGLSANLDQPTDIHAYVWIKGVTWDLNNFIPVEKLALLKRAKAINNVGQIVTDGDLDGENTFTFLLTPVDAPLGDLDGDCSVGKVDLVTLLLEWGEINSPADLNNDDIVSTADLLILLANWG